MDCSRLPDGAYGSGCSPTFTLCSDGESYLRKCPLGLLFDGAKKRCEYPDKACAKASMSSRAPASVAAPSPPLAAVSSPAAATTEHDHIIKQSEPPGQHPDSLDCILVLNRGSCESCLGGGGEGNADSDFSCYCCKRGRVYIQQLFERKLSGVLLHSFVLGDQ